MAPSQPPHPAPEPGGPGTGHYGETYFAWQSTVGEFGGWANLPKFAPHVASDHDVLDFGCGGGFLLQRLACRRRIGVEVNPTAAQEARRRGVEVHARVEDVPDACVDVVISNHALEHTRQPLQELTALRRTLRTGGRIVVFVPCDSAGVRFRADDIHRHLYSWSPMNLGNLLVEAGYTLIEAGPYLHKWPPGHRMIARIGGRFWFDAACRLYGWLDRSWVQVRAVAEKR